MANRPQQLTLPSPRSYTRTDFAALRAFVQRVPLPSIARLYFDPDTAPHAAGADALERYLRTMRDDLVHLATLHGSSVLADHLKASIRNHGSAKLTAVTLRMGEQASRLAAGAPAGSHPVGLWLRPLVARRLIGEGSRRSAHWWTSATAAAAAGGRPCRVSVYCARGCWSRGCAGMPARWVPRWPRTLMPRIRLRRRRAPLERVALPHALSGGEGPHGNGTRGLNRAPGLCYLQARHGPVVPHGRRLRGVQGFPRAGGAASARRCAG